MHEKDIMKVILLDIKGLILVQLKIIGDPRGFFTERFHEEQFLNLGLPVHFVQDNHSRSGPGVLRGLHYQYDPPQGKLVGVARGRIWDVAVDIRPKSPSFGKSAALELSDMNGRLLWIPPGFAHGFLVLSDFAELLYKTTDFYAPEHERCIRWDDPDIGIDWPLTGEPLLSQKDRQGLPLKEAELFA